MQTLNTFAAKNIKSPFLSDGTYKSGCCGIEMHNFTYIHQCIDNGIAHRVTMNGPKGKRIEAIVQRFESV